MIEDSQLAAIAGANGYSELMAARSRYRQIAPEVLEEILVENGMFRMIDGSPASVAQYNTAVALMDKMGFLDEANVKRILEFMYTLPLVGSEDRELMKYRTKE